MSNFADPNIDTYAQKLIMASGSATEPSICFANDLTKGLYFDSTTGTINIVGSAGGASTALDNLTNPTAINQSLLTDTPSTYDLGSISSPFGSLFIGTTINLSDDAVLLLNPTLKGALSQRSDNGQVILTNDHLTEATSFSVYQDTLRFDAGGGFRGSISTPNTGETSLSLYDADSASVTRVKVGANNTGPGGVGRALYVDNN